MQVKRICFIGRHNLPSHYWRNLRYKLERARPGELEGFQSQTDVIRTRSIIKADIVYARNCPEKTTDRGLARLQRLIRRVDDGSRLVVNPQQDFHRVDCKDDAFTAWTKAGIRCPRHWQLETDHDDPDDIACVDQIRELIKKNSRILLRTNNECASNGLQIVDHDTSTDQLISIFRRLKARTARLRKKRSQTRSVAVEFVDARDADGYAVLARVFVLLDRIISYFAVTSDKLRFVNGDMLPDAYDRFIESNIRLRRLVEDEQTRAEIFRSVSALGNNIGAVEFLMDPQGGPPVFLEVNTHWGGVPGRYSFGSDEFAALLEQRLDHWPKLVPNIDQNLRTVDFYRDMYSYMAQYHGRENRDAGAVSRSKAA